MRRISVITIIFILLFSGAAYGFKIGGFAGYNIYLEDVSGDVTKGGLAYGGTITYSLILLDVGLLSGYFPMLSSSTSDIYTIPVLAYGKFGLGPVYLMGGVGVYFADGGDNFGFAIGGGYKAGLGIIGINIGALYHNISGGGSDISMLTLLGGIELGF